MIAIENRLRVRHGWFSRLAGLIRPRFAMSRPGPDLRAMSAHMRRDIGLVDGAHVWKQL